MNSQLSEFLISFAISGQIWSDILISVAVGYLIIYFLRWYGFLGKLEVDGSTSENNLVVSITWLIISLCVSSCIQYVKIIILTGIFL